MNAFSNTGTTSAGVTAGVSLSAIRPLQPLDVEPLRQLLTDTNVFHPDEIAIALELMHTVLEKAEQRDYVIRVYDDGGVLGYYCIGPTPATASTFDLYWIAVSPTAQGKGIGKALNRHAEELISAMGGRLIVAETSSTPRYDKTRAFYIAAGYRELARIRDYYRAGDSLVVFGKYI